MYFSEIKQKNIQTKEISRIDGTQKKTQQNQSIVYQGGILQISLQDTYCLIV